MQTTSIPPRSHSLTATHFSHTCGYCGCVFRVDVTWKISYSYKAPHDIKVYACPECLRDSRIKTSTEPQVTLISRRTDGRSGPCRVEEPIPE